jgi:LysM repeat protein
MMAVGLDPNDYMVGEGMSINPITGMAEFGFLKKLGKSLKKVVKKVAPLAGALLIPGVGGALSGALGSVGSALGIPSGIGSSLLGGKGILDTAAAVRGGIAGIGSNLFGGQQPTQQTIQQGDTLNSIAAANNVTVEELMDANPTIKDKDAIVAGDTIAIPGVNVPRTGFNIGRAILGKGNTPDFIKGIEDIVKGPDGKIGGGDALGGNAGLMALAALYGKATKEAAEKTAGGLQDIRTSVRPDLMPQPTFQGFDLGIRPGMSYGGSMDEQELDLRMGGPSIGPGTGTSDDIPAMLSDGEFVMTSAANNGLGGFKITKTETGIELIPNGAPDRQKGAKNMDKLMKTFEQFNEIGKV